MPTGERWSTNSLCKPIVVLHRLNAKAHPYRLEKEKIGAVEPSEVSANEDRAKVLMLKLNTLITDSPYQWLFSDKPSALDTHLIPFIARMKEVGRTKLIPQALGEYADRAMRGKEWTGLMESRRTMPP